MKTKTFTPVIGIPFNERAQPESILTFDSIESIKTFLTLKYGGGMAFGIDHLLKQGEYRYMAYSYDFTPYLTKYLVHSEYGDLMCRYAPSIKELRKSAYLSRQDKVYLFPKK